MKKELKFLIYVHLFILAFLTYLVSDLISLLYDDSFKDALLSTDLNPPPDSPPRTQLIPKIIHQTYKNTTIPEKWQEGQQNCIDLHPDYQYILWTDSMAEQFIADNYPWFLPTFINYPYNIQRADSIRYFVLYHYGGIYIDLDDGCQRRLDPLLSNAAFVRKTQPSGISNDVMGGVPRHPFYQKVLENLQKYNYNYLVPYITVMFTTGPLFLSVIWKRYKRWGVPPDTGVVRILLPDDYKKHEYSFFKISKGDSWHQGDALFIKSLAHHIVECVIAGTLFVLLILYLEYRLYVWLQHGNYVKMKNFLFYKILRLSNNNSYQSLDSSDYSDDYDIPRFHSNASSDNHDRNPSVFRQSSNQQKNSMLKLVGLLNKSSIMNQIFGRNNNPRRNRKDSNIILPNVDIELDFTNADENNSTNIE